MKLVYSWNIKVETVLLLTFYSPLTFYTLIRVKSRWGYCCKTHVQSLSLGSRGRTDQVCLFEHFAADCSALHCFIFPAEGCRGCMGSPPAWRSASWCHIPHSFNSTSWYSPFCSNGKAATIIFIISWLFKLMPVMLCNHDEDYVLISCFKPVIRLFK